MNAERWGRLTSTSHAVVVPSIDGVATAAAALRTIARRRRPKNPDAIDFGFSFTTARNIQQVDVRRIRGNVGVMLINLAVSNRSGPVQHSPTVRFVEGLRLHGHGLTAIVDEHQSADWGLVLQTAGINPANLAIMPETRGGTYGTGQFRSSGSVFRSYFEPDELDAHTLELLEAANQADQGRYGTHFGDIINRVVKADPRCEDKAEYLIRHLAFTRKPDKLIESWMEGYEQVERDTREVLRLSRTMLDGRVRRVDITGRRVDYSTLTNQAFNSGSAAVVAEDRDTAERKWLGLLVNVSPRVRCPNLCKALTNDGLRVVGGAYRVECGLDEEEQALRLLARILPFRNPNPILCA